MATTGDFNLAIDKRPTSSEMLDIMQISPQPEMHSDESSSPPVRRFRRESHADEDHSGIEKGQH